MFDKLLQQLGFDLKYEDLTKDEKDAIHKRADDLSKQDITVSDMRDYVSKMRGGVERELTKTGLNDEQDTFLKARLRNYMLLEDFLMGPIQARKILEKKN